MKEEIIDGNELIATFMGWKMDTRYKNDTVDKLFDIWSNGKNAIMFCNLKFHSSWDWLMPVCEKIESLGSIEFIINGSVIISWDDGTAYFNETLPDGKSKADTIYFSIVKFLKWHKTIVK